MPSRVAALRQVTLRRAGDTGGGGGGGSVTVPLNVDLTAGQSQTWTLTDAATTTAPDIFGLRHVTTATAAAGFGLTTWMELENAAGTMRRVMTDVTRYTSATAGAEVAHRDFNLILAGTLTPAISFDWVLNANLPAVLFGGSGNGIFWSGTTLATWIGGNQQMQWGASATTAQFPLVCNGLLTTNATILNSLADATTTTAPDIEVSRHTTSGTAGIGFGVTNAVELESAGGTTRRVMTDVIALTVATNAAEEAQRIFSLMTGGSLTQMATLSYANGGTAPQFMLGATNNINGIRAYAGLSRLDLFSGGGAYIILTGSIVQATLPLSVNGTITNIIADTTTTTAPDSLIQRHTTTGTAAVGFGLTNAVELQNAAGTTRRVMTDVTAYTTATNAAEVATRTIGLMFGGGMQDALVVAFNSLQINGGSAHVFIGQYGDVFIGRQNGTGACEISGSLAGISLLNRIHERKGADIASASTITVGIDGNYVHVTGSTAIDFLTNTGTQDGTRLELYFVAAVTVNNNTGAPPAGTHPFALSGSVNYAATAGSRLSVRRDAALGKWVEVARTPG